MGDRHGKKYMRFIILRHFLVSFAWMVLATSLCTLFQFYSAYDFFWPIICAILSVSGFVFSVVFAIYQFKLKQNLRLTIILAAALAIYLIVLFYGFIHVKIDWQAISEEKLQLSLWQQWLKSDLSFWLAFFVPFILSFVIYTFKSKQNSST